MEVTKKQKYLNVFGKDLTKTNLPQIKYNNI